LLYPWAGCGLAVDDLWHGLGGKCGDGQLGFDFFDEDFYFFDERLEG
jgi:hypothetical protein